MGHALAHDRAHRAPAKVEIHHAERNREALERSESGYDCLGEPRLRTIGFELLLVGTLIGPPERIARQYLVSDLDEICVD